MTSPETARLVAQSRADDLAGRNGIAAYFWQATKGLAAFNLEAVHTGNAMRITRKIRNQHGTSYTFTDGTRLFITRGNPQRQRLYDARGYGVAARSGVGS
jgi:hypothetical protein